MKKFFAFVLISGCGIFLLAAEVREESRPAPAAAVLLAADAKITAPLALKDGVLSQPEQTELAQGGKAVFPFALAKAGTYVVQAVVNAPGEDANSFYLNIDGQPADPLMIWDIDVTTGFEERTVSWRGKGDPTGDEFLPKRFTLSAGDHKLVLVGREPAQLKSLLIRPAGN
jgi:hypothetical protein